MQRSQLLTDLNREQYIRVLVPTQIIILREYCVTFAFLTLLLRNKQSYIFLWKENLLTSLLTNYFQSTDVQQEMREIKVTD